MTQDMTGYRRAAVALHRLEEEDRNWILAELPEPDRKTVTGLLNELNDLGFVPESMPDDIPVALPSVTAAVEATPAQRISLAAANDVWAVLEVEPVTLIGQVVALQDWPWKDAVVDRLPPQRRQQVLAILNAKPMIAPARKECLINLLSARLAALPANEPQTVVGSRSRVPRLPGIRLVSRLKQVVKPWKRS